jgi:hypothetical protein
VRELPTPLQDLFLVATAAHNSIHDGNGANGIIRETTLITEKLKVVVPGVVELKT